MSSHRRIRVAFHVQGIVQGVGFRPFVHNQALKYGLSGWVKNGRGGVDIEVAGLPRDIASFCDALRLELPSPGKVDVIRQKKGSNVEDDPRTFRILPSDEMDAPSALLPPDLAICAECRTDVNSPANRRHRYAWTCCAHCGPRYSIVESLPYDRARTSMRTFTLCAACQSEYEDPTNRRFHAEPLACAECGPRVMLLSRDGACQATADEAIGLAAARLQQGAIVALRGIGGFQLLCDATSSAAVKALRQRKLRPEKPFAVLFSDFDAVNQAAFVSPNERDELLGGRRPIVLLRQKDPSIIAREVAPNCPLMGAMLPTTALHALLSAAVGRPLVCTSGNLSGEPLCVDTPTALQRLGNIADVFLTHDRPIVRPVDDSVVREGTHGIHVLRRARGFAPLPVFHLDDERCILGLGAQLKSTISLLVRGDVIMSQHLGDLDDPDSVDLLSTTVSDLLRFFAVRPDLVACDLHPDFASSRLAHELATKLRIPRVGVQHHHAHVAAVLAERNIQDDVFALVWDGFGFGLDGKAWGGEAFVVKQGAFLRVGHLQPFQLPGGDKAAEEPWRSALGLLVATLGNDGLDYAKQWWPNKNVELLVQAMTRGFSAPWTTSMGRLFDAVAALLNLCSTVSFEGQAAMELEWLAETNHEGMLNPYEFPLTNDQPWIADCGPLVRGILADLRRGRQVAEIAARFIASLVDLAVRACQRANVTNVVLTGGCFQNNLLTRTLVPKLERLGFQVFLPRDIPVNDGSISAGQVVVAAQFPSLTRGA